MPANVEHKLAAIMFTDIVGYTALMALFATALVGLACAGSRPRVGVVVTDGGPTVTLMDFGSPLALDALPAGWFHRTFRRHGPMEISFVHKEGRAAIRLATRDSASMLFRQVDVPLDAYGGLAWDWLVEKGVDSPLDERTVAGDDHPARLYLSFVAGDGSDHAMEIVWGNRTLRAGDWKHLTFFRVFSFPHYVANGGPENVGRWHDERVDLRALFRELWGDPAGARLVEVALFCDTDETGVESVAYFGKVEARRE